MDFDKLERCDTFFKRLRGLMFSKKRNLLFEFKKETRANAIIHTFFVFYPIDVYWLDEDKKIIDKRRMKPFRIAIPRNKAKYVVERC